MELEGLQPEINAEQLTEAVQVGLLYFIALDPDNNTPEKYKAIYMGALTTYLNMLHTEENDDDEEFIVLDLDVMRCIVAFPALEGLSSDPELDPSMQTSVHTIYPIITAQNYKRRSIQELINDDDLSPAVQNVISALAMISLHPEVNWAEVTIPPLHTQIIGALKLKSPESVQDRVPPKGSKKPKPH